MWSRDRMFSALFARRAGWPWSDESTRAMPGTQRVTPPDRSAAGPAREPRAPGARDDLPFAAGDLGATAYRTRADTGTCGCYALPIAHSGTSHSRRVVIGGVDRGASNTAAVHVRAGGCIKRVRPTSLLIGTVFLQEDCSPREEVMPEPMYKRGR